MTDYKAVKKRIKVLEEKIAKQLELIRELALSVELNERAEELGIAEGEVVAYGFNTKFLEGAERSKFISQPGAAEEPPGIVNYIRTEDGREIQLDPPIGEDTWQHLIPGLKAL